MINDYYNATTTITEDSKARSTTLNAVLQSIKAGFDLLPGKDKLNQNRVAYVSDTGSANTYIAAMIPTLTAYTSGLKVRMLIANTNTGASTLNIDSQGARSIKRQDGTDPDAGDLTAGDIHDFIYDGTNFVLATPSRAHMAGIASNLASDLTLSGDNTFSGNNTFSGSITHTGTETFDDDALVVRNVLDTTKKASFDVSGISTATTRSFTFPDASGTFVLAAATQTLTNKTLTAPTIAGGALSGTFSGNPTLSGNPVFSGAPDFSGALNKSTIRSNLGLGTAAVETVQSSATDTTAGTIALQGNDAKFAAVSLTGQSLIFDSAGWPSTSILRSDTSGVQYIFGGTSGINGATIALFGSTHATNPNLMVLEGDGIIFRAVDNTEYARFDNSGNLGIGTGIPSADLHVNGPIRCGSYTVATVPSAATVGAGTIIYVTDEIGGATHAASDGTNWRRMSDRAIIS